MELASEEFVGSNNNDQSHLIVKGKRTKRRHGPSSPSPPPPPTTLAAVTSSSSSAGGGGDEYLYLSSPTTSYGGGGGEIYESTEEEEDMANCLILLAQGDHAPKQIEKLSSSSISTRKFNDITATATASMSGIGKAGFFVYECKTCNRTFPSFQALGGHRASHKKPRAAMVEYKKASPPITCNIMDDYEEVLVFNKVTSISTSTPPPPPTSNNTLPLQIANAKALIQSNKTAKIHECSICGTEFTSGQALGGHMRRHRASSNAQSFEVGTNTSTSTTRTASMDEMKQRNILALDLNLPAPEDDHRESKFQFVPTQQALVFSAPALVDCHY